MIKYILLIIAIVVSIYIKPSPVTSSYEAPLPEPSAIKQMSGGFDNMIASIAWIYVMGYTGQEGTPVKDTRLTKALDIVSTLNPNMHNAYYMAATYVPWINSNPDISLYLVKRAMKENPDAWIWAYYIAFNHYWFYHDIKTASRYMSIAASKKDVPQQIIDLSLKMESTSGNIDTAISFLINEIKHSKKDVRFQLLNKLKLLRTEEYIRHFKGKFNSNSCKLAMSKVIRLPDGGTLICENGVIRSSKNKRYIIHESKNFLKRNR